MHELLWALIAAALLWLAFSVARAVFKMLMATRWARRKMMDSTVAQIQKLTTPEGAERLRTMARQTQEDLAAALEANGLRADPPPELPLSTTSTRLP